MRLRALGSALIVLALGCKEPGTTSLIGPGPANLDVEVEEMARASSSAQPLVQAFPNVELLSLQVFVPGGDLRGTLISSLHVDVTETTVAAYRDCIDNQVCPPIPERREGRGCESTIAKSGHEHFP